MAKEMDKGHIEKLPGNVGEKLTLIEDVKPNKSIDSMFYRGTFDETLQIDVFVRRLNSEKMKTNSGKQEADRDRVAHLLTGAHENIIRYYFHDKIGNDCYYIVTEWCILSVEDLFETDDENKVIREEIHQSLTSKDILRQTTQGLVFLHTFDFVHRNIKPSNVLISQDKLNATKYVVKLSDFRTCKNLLNEPENSGDKGSGGWIAPKPGIYGDKSRPSEDVFILGCFFYYVLHPNHQHPFGKKKSTREMNVKNPKHKVYGTDWDHGLAQSQAIALIKEMIKYNPAERPVLKTILDRAYFLPDDYYKIYDVPGVTPGRCVIFNQENFKTLKQRNGSEKDKKSLTTIFKDFGFDVKSHDDLSSKEIEDEIIKLATEKYADYGCLVVCILSHGDEGTICGSDFRKLEDGSCVGQVSIEDLKKEFYGIESLDGKPKIWLIQACQGHHYQEEFVNSPKVDGKIENEIDEGYNQQLSNVTLNGTNVDQENTASDSDILVPDYAITGPDISRPPISDFLDIRATVPGCVSFRDPIEGSYLIQHLCQQLEKAFVKREQPHRHLEDLLKTVQKIISKEPCKQTIEWRSTLIDFIRFEKH